MKKLNSKRQATYDAIYREPKSSDIYGEDIVKLLIYLGCEMKQGNGSRVTFVYNERRMKMHLPHKKDGKKPLLKYQIDDVRQYLKDIGQNLYGGSSIG